MKRILFGFLLFSCCAAPLFASISTGAEKLINQVDPNLNIGLVVLDLDTGMTLYQRNKDRSFIPASNMKLFSDAAALMVLGPDYRFRNQLSTSSSQLQNGVLKGSLYLSLPGDPSFSHERLSNLIAALKGWGIRHIQGSVIIDSSHAAISPYAPGALAEDRAYGYGAAIAPVMIDANRMLVTVNPAGSPGSPAIVEVADASSSIRVNNQVTTKTNVKNCGVDIHMDANNQLTVRGCIRLGQWAIQQNMAIQNPLLYAQGLIRQELYKANILLDGQVSLGNTPSGAMLIASDSSKPISQLMADTLKPSDNLYADSLYLHAAHKLAGKPVNWPQAADVIKPFLEKQTGISLSSAKLIDGSGLSRHDILTAAQTVALLQFLYDRFPLAYEYIAALPISGRDGTLQKRFKKPNQQDLVRAKTGTMRGITSLSGYLSTTNAHTLAFAIFLNKNAGTKTAVSQRFRYVIDALTAYFLTQSPSNTNWVRLFKSRPRIQYQLNPTQAELQRKREMRWRQLEMAVKRALKGQEVALIYRANELILRDSQRDPARVLASLQTLHRNYPFALALSSKESPSLSVRPLVFWLEATSLPDSVERIWTIRETVS